MVISYYLTLLSCKNVSHDFSDQFTVINLLLELLVRLAEWSSKTKTRRFEYGLWRMTFYPSHSPTITLPFLLFRLFKFSTQVICKWEDLDVFLYLKHDAISYYSWFTWSPILRKSGIENELFETAAKKERLIKIHQ